MSHLPNLIEDLGLILVTAAIVTLLSRWLRQPVVLGYILAGFLVGPKFPFLPDVVDPNNIRTWAEMGIIFLLFSLGLEFSLKKLLQVGGAALITAFCELGLMLTLGYVVGRGLSWPHIDSLFLGGILAISSTSIIVRTFSDLRISHHLSSQLVFGILIIEDLVAILLLVLLSTVALGQQLEGSELFFSIFKVTSFLTFWFVIGIFFVPPLVKRVRKLLSDDMLLVFSLGLCLLLVKLATFAGLSSALGAFLAGSILAETVEVERIEHIARPIRDLFSAIFFVSVGMLLDPQVIASHWPVILLLSAVLIIGKILGVTIGSLFAGYTLPNGLQAGLSMTQIGEFSFIIATLGVSLNVIQPSLYPIAVAVSVITTFTTPYLVKNAPFLGQWTEQKLPQKWQDFLKKFASDLQKSSSNSSFRTILLQQVTATLINFVLGLTIGFLSAKIFIQYSVQYIDSSLMRGVVGIPTCVFIVSPFLWALTYSGFRNKKLMDLWYKSDFRVSVAMILVARIFLAVLLIGLIITRFLPYKTSLLMSIASLLAGIYFLSRRLEPFYEALARRFLRNLSGEERRKTPRPQLAPWHAHTTKIEVPMESELVGQSLMSINLRQRFGLTILLIERGRKKITAPKGDVIISGGDHLLLIGTDEQMDRFERWLEPQNQELEETQQLFFELRSLTLTDHSPLSGLTVKNSRMQENVSGLIVGVERMGQRILNPHADFQLKKGDLLWIVGESKQLKSFMEQFKPSELSDSAN